EIHEFREDNILLHVITAMMFVYVAALEWFSAYFSLPRRPMIYTVTALIAVSVAAYKIYVGRKKLISLRQGRDGEKAVGQYLERLRVDGAHVFHDVPGQKFNLDHVVIAKSGIYVVETKTYSKPDKGDAVVV